MEGLFFLNKRHFKMIYLEVVIDFVYLQKLNIYTNQNIYTFKI